MKSKSPFLLRVGVLALAFAGAGAARAQDGITVYNAQHASLTQAWADGFTKETGIKVTIRKGSDTELANQIVQEGAASPADVFVTENSPAMVLVERAGLFATLRKDVLDHVPAQFRPTSGRWTGVAARSTVFAYDKRKLKEADLPKSMLDLADAKWKGRWAASPSGADFQAIVGALLVLKGEPTTADWLKAMKANSTAYRGNSVAMKAVNAGEVEGAVIYHYYFFGDQAKTAENSANVGLHYFRHQDPGAFLSTSGAGVLASSKHAKEAEAFVKWMSGKHGQAVLREGDSFEYAIGNGEASNPRLEPIARLEAPKVEPSQLDSKEVTEWITAAGLL
ncbi:iron ABC transporter substrate-binding protein [soil metagenome]